MEKPKFLRKLSVIAAALTVIGIMLNVVMVLNPHIAAVLLSYGSIKELMETKLSSLTQTLMLCQAASPVLILTCCGIVCFSDKLSEGKCKAMLVLIPIAYILSSLLSSMVYTYAIKASVSDGMNALSLLSSITTVRAVISYLYTFSFVIMMCAVSVEYYITKTIKQP